MACRKGLMSLNLESRHDNRVQRQTTGSALTVSHSPVSLPLLLTFLQFSLERNHFAKVHVGVLLNKLNVLFFFITQMSYFGFSYQPAIAFGFGR